MGWFSEPPETGGPSDVNPETEGHAKLLKATMYTLSFEGRGTGWVMGGKSHGGSKPPTWMRDRRLDQNRRAGAAPQAARMSSFEHPAQHLYIRGSDFLMARLSLPRSFPAFSHEGHCAHMFRLSRLRIVTCWVISNAGRLNPTVGMKAGTGGGGSSTLGIVIPSVRASSSARVKRRAFRIRSN
jgi:hypothetical protein